MTTQASDLTPVALVTRAKAAVGCGDHLGAIAASLAAIAELMVEQADTPEPIPPGATPLNPEAIASLIAAHVKTKQTEQQNDPPDGQNGAPRGTQAAKTTQGEPA